MVESKELRLENEVLYCGENRKVTMIDWVTVQLEDCEGYISVTDLEPIPLTPEVLITCGFIKTGRYAIGAGSYHTYVLGKFELLLPWKDSPFVLAFYETPMSFLHQLQNVYFALIGQELTYNP